MMDAKLDTLLRGHAFGPLRLGTCVHDVLSLLGEPGDRSLEESPLILRYDSLELTFYATKLVGISCHLEDERFPKMNPLRLVGWVPTSPCDYESFRSFLRSSGIRFEPHPELNFPDQFALLTEGGASAHFERVGAIDVLRSIHLFDASFLSKAAAARVRELRDVERALRRPAEGGAPDNTSS